MKQNKVGELILLDNDVVELRKLLNDKASVNRHYMIRLQDEILRAQVVARPELPDTVVTMHSTAIVLDLKDNEEDKYTLVYPWEADADTGKISVLAPIGTALIGYRKGDEIDWQMPGGMTRLRILSVEQPA
jgi:regulator of nucleoside diphosphate kinase